MAEQCASLASRETNSNQLSCRLTPRSTGRATASHLGPVGGTRYIFANRAKAPCLRAPVTSNVRHHKASMSVLVASNAAAAVRDRLRGLHAMNSYSCVPPHPACQEYKALTSLRSVLASSGNTHDLLASAARRGINRGRPSPTHHGSQFLVQPPGAPWWLLPTLHAAAAELPSAGLATQSPCRLRTLVFPPWRLVAVVACPSWRVLPNPSFNRTRYGRPPWPGWRYAVHFRQPGQGVLPSRAG